MINFFHHLFNPHCPNCIEEKQCQNCETLRQLLDQERYEKSRLLDQIIELTKPIIVNEVREKSEEPKPLQSHIPWKVRRAILEQEDRVKARIEKEHKLTEVKPLTVAELEKKLGVNEDAPGITEEAS